MAELEADRLERALEADASAMLAARWHRASEAVADACFRDVDRLEPEAGPWAPPAVRAELVARYFRLSAAVDSAYTLARVGGA